MSIALRLSVFSELRYWRMPSRTASVWACWLEWQPVPAKAAANRSAPKYLILIACSSHLTDHISHKVTARRTPSRTLLHSVQCLGSFTSCSCSRHTDILVGAAIIKQPLFSALRHSFHKHHIRHLAVFLPLPLGHKNWFFASIQHFSRIILVKYRDPPAIDQMVIRSVLHQHNAIRR